MKFGDAEPGQYRVMRLLVQARWVQELLLPRKAGKEQALVGRVGRPEEQKGEPSLLELSRHEKNSYEVEAAARASVSMNLTASSLGGFQGAQVPRPVPRTNVETLVSLRREGNFAPFLTQ